MVLDGLARFERSHSMKYSSSPLESRKRVQHKVENFVLDKSGSRQGFLAVSPQITFIQVPNLLLKARFWE